MKCSKKHTRSFFFIIFFSSAICQGAYAGDPLYFTTNYFQEQHLAFYPENTEILKTAGWNETLNGNDFRETISKDNSDTAEILITKGLLAQHGFFNSTQSVKKAIDYYTQAIVKHQSPLAMCNLGALLLTVKGSHASHASKAYNYFEGAAKQNYAPGLYCLATFYFDTGQSQISSQNHKENKLPVTGMSESDIKQIKKAIDKNYAPACVFYAEDLLTKAKLSDEEKESVKTNLQNAAGQQHPQAQFILANYYAKGNSVFEQDVEKAIEMIMLAAEQKYPPALYRWGIWNHGGFYTGNKTIVTKNPEKALKLIKQAADLGYPTAQYSMGEHLAKQEKTEANQALLYMEKAAARKYPDAMCTLGLWHIEGEWVEKNKAKGIRLLKESADLGSTNAQVQLDVLKLYPKKHFSMAYHEAKALFNSAEKKQRPVAAYNLGEMYYSGDYSFTPKRKRLRASFYFRSALAMGYGTPEEKLELEGKIKKAEAQALKKHPSLHTDVEYAFYLYQEDGFEELEEVVLGKPVKLLQLHEAILPAFDCREDIKSLKSKTPKEHRLPSDGNLVAFLRQYGHWCIESKSEDATLAADNYTADNPAAWCHRGLLAINEEDFDKAQELFEKASKADFPAGHYCLAKAILHQLKRSDDNPDLKSSALVLLKKAADQEFAPAQYCLGCYLMKVELQKKNRQSDNKEEEKREEQPSPDSYWNNIQEATKLISKAAAQDFGPAEYCKALLILKGNIIIKKRQNETNRLINRAAEKGYPPAINAQGQIALESLHIDIAGIHIPSSNQQVEQLFLEASRLGYAPADYNCGRVYEHGYGVTKDLIKATRYYQQAVKKGVLCANRKLHKLGKKTNTSCTTREDLEAGFHQPSEVSSQED